MEKKSKIIIVILLILVICTILTHFFLTPSTTENNGLKNVTDMINRNITIPETVNHVIATGPSMTTIIYMLDPDKLRAVNFQWNDEELELVPYKYRDLPVVGGWYGSQEGSYEEFIASEPDIIIESIEDGDVSNVQERQDKFGEIPVVAVKDASDLKEMPKSIIFMGEILGTQEKAKELSDFDNKYLNITNQTASQIPDSDKKSVYFAEGEDGLQTVLSDSPQSQQIDLVGAKNAANELNQGNTSSGIQVSIEQVIKWNPDIIITTNPDFYNTIKTDSNWAHIDAVKNGEVYLSPQSPFKWFGRPIGANLIIGLPWTAKVVYPDQYDNINLVEATQEFYSKFYHTDLNTQQTKQILLNSGLKEKNL